MRWLLRETKHQDTRAFVGVIGLMPIDDESGMRVIQRSVMRELFSQHGGDQETVIAEYVRAEREGRVPRVSQSSGDAEYARRLWLNGISTGWLDAAAIKGTPEMDEPTTPKPKQARSLPSFDVALGEMGEFWRDSPLRPRPTIEALTYWSALVDEWVADESMPLLIRKGSLKTLRCVHPKGRTFVRCDNSPAHWAFMGAFRDARPSLADVREQLTLGHVPMALARTREESKRIADGLDEAMGGHLGQSRYGQVNKFPGGMAYKLCHLEGIGIKARGDVQDLPVTTLQSHMRRFLDPLNMIVVPLEYAGVGECAAFLAPFFNR